MGRVTAGQVAGTVFVLVACVGAGSGPRAFAQAPATDAPTFRSSARLTLVSVDVVVTRKDGTPVEGLTADDFVVLHGGEPVPISNFREEKRAAGRGDAPPLAPASASPAAPPVGAGRPLPGARDAAGGARPRRHLLFFVDDLALPERREREEVFAALGAILTRTLEPGDDAMIVTWRRGIRRVFPFTGDLALLERRLDAVARDAGRLGQEAATELEQLVADDAYYRWAEQGDSELSRNRLIQERWLEVKSKLVALRGLVGSMAGLEGRKDLILVSRRLSKIAGVEYEGRHILKDAKAGPPGLAGAVSGINTMSYIEDLVDAANAVGVTIHSIYGEGWSMDAPSAASPSALPPGVSPLDVRRTQQTWSNEMATLGLVSERTGGVLIGSTAEASRFADRVSSGLAHWYSIGYPRPEGTESSGKISVRVKRPGLVVRSRKAFVDRPAGDAMRERVVANLFRRDESAKLAIAVEAGSPVASGKDRWVTPLRVRVPVRSLALVPDGAEAKGAVTLYRVSATPVGEVSNVAEERHAVRVPAELASADSAVVLDYEVEVEAVDAASRISIGVLDETSGLAGFRVVLPARR